MATYYWVGGSGTWDQSSTANWSLTSGGAGGAGYPIFSDNVVFDDNSGTGTVTLDNPACTNWTATRVAGTNTLTFVSLSYYYYVSIYGNISWTSSIMSFSGDNTLSYLIFYATAPTLNFGGVSVGATVYFGSGATLNSAMNVGALNIFSGTFTTNNNSVTISSGDMVLQPTATFGPGGNITCNFGSSAVSVANNIYFRANSLGALILNFGTSVITTVNSTTSINFESTYTGAATYAIDTTSSAGHALRPNGDLLMVILGSVPVRLLLQQVGNTTGNTVNYFRIGGDLPAGSIVTLGGTTNCNDFLGQSGTVTFTGAVVVTNLFTADYNITLTCSSTLTCGSVQLDSNNNQTFSGAIVTTDANGSFNTTSRVPTTFPTVTCAGNFTSGDTGAGAGGALTFPNVVSVNGTMSLANSSLVTINNTITVTSFSRSNGDLTLGAFTYTIRSSWYMQAGYTLTRSTSTIALTGLNLASAAIDTSFDSGGYTYQNVSIAGNLQTIQDTTGGSTALACAGTFTGTTLTNTYGVLNLTIGLNVTGALSLTGNSLVNRYFVRSNVHSTARSITRASNTLTNVDFSDITFTGAAASGTSIGNCLGNTNITFTAAVNRFARASGDWSSTGVWSATSGGATGATAPLPQDTVIFNAASGSITVNTADRRALGVNVFTTGFNGTINVNNTGLRGSFIYGTIQTSTTTTITGTDAIIMAARNALYNIEIRKAISAPVVVYGCNATYTVTNALSTTGAVSVTAGTFDLLANPLTCASLSTWYTPYSAFMPALSPDPSPITVNLNANTVTVSGDISNDWQNYPNTPQSIATVNATNATITAANIVFRYATFTTGTSTISLTGNIELGYPAGNPSSLTGNANLVFGPASTALYAWGGANTTCNSITTASNFTLYSNTVITNSLSLGGNLAFVGLTVANNVTITAAKSIISASLNTNSLTVGGKILTFQDRAAFLTSSSGAYKLAFTYSGSATALETNNFLYFFNVNVVSGSVLAPAVTNLGYNSGITFTGTARRIGFSGYSGAITLPTDVTPGAVIFAWGGGGGAGKRATSTSVLSTTGGGSGAMSINVNVPITSGATVYVNAAVATSKQTANANGATGGSSWINLISNTTPVNNTQGVLAVGGGGSSISSGAGGSGGLSISCIGDQAIGGLSGGGFLGNLSTRNYLGGTGGASFFFVGGSQTVNTDTTASNNNRGGVGGGGVYGAGTNFAALSPNGTAGGLNQNSVAAAGGTGGNPPTAGASGTLGGGGAGGGGQVVTTPLSGSFTRSAGTLTATITYPNHGLKVNDVVYLTLAYVTGTYTVSGLISGATWVRTAGSTTVNITTPSAHGLTTGNRRFFAFSGTNAPSTGMITLTVTGTTTLQITSSTPNTLAGSGTVNIGGLMTVTTTTPHGLIVGDTPYQTINNIGNSGPPVETVIDANNFTVARVTFSGTGGSTTLGSGLTTTADWARTITAVTTNTFSFTTSSATYIYALATCTYRNPNGLGGNGGDGVNSSTEYQLDYYNNVFYPSKYPVGLGGGGGGAGGVYTSSAYIYTGTGGSGGDGGIAAGGGGMGYGQQAGAASSFVAGNGGAGGPGLIIIQYQVAQGTSQAGFVG